MKITKDTNILIYGAGARGYFYKDKLKKLRMSKISAFLDKNASELKPQTQTPIYTVKESVKRGLCKKNTIVIITVANVFSHEEIAQDLYKNGYQAILFQPVFQKGDIAKEISYVYETLFDVCSEVPIVGMELPEYRKLSDNLTDASNTISANSKIITSWVPIDLLFGLTKQLYESLVGTKSSLEDQIADQHMFVFNISGELMQSFENGINEETWDNYMGTYKTVRNYVMHKEDKNKFYDLDVHIRERYKVYQNMDRLLAAEPEFFQKYPIDVRWNEKGYFNIEDGNNRASFLLSKKIYMVPCKMKKEEYDLWQNKKQLKNVKTMLRRYPDIQLLHPIQHPFFLKNVFYEGAFSRKKLHIVLSWMTRKAILPRCCTVLDMVCGTGYYGQILSKIGSDVTAVQENEAYYEMYKAVDKLLYTDSIRVEHSLEAVKDKSYDLVFAPREAAAESRTDLLLNICSITGKIMVLDVERNTKRREWITQNTDFCDCVILGTYPLYEKIYNVSLFLKTMNFKGER